jgi:hypothetical protein
MLKLYIIDLRFRASDHVKNHSKSLNSQNNHGTYLRMSQYLHDHDKIES